MLRLINIYKSYKFGKNKEIILNNINIDFKKHELVFILGKSGSGKSTLLNIIGGMVEVDSGSILLDDKDITQFNNSMLCNYRNNMVGFVFQDYHLIEYMSVMDNVKLGMTIKDNASNRIEEILRKLGIYSKRNVKVTKLSGGEKQRVAIARAIINNPDIILCDEPTGALDSVNSKKIFDILKQLSEDKLVIVVSHDAALANKYADRIINIIDGKIDYYPQIDDGKFKEIKEKKIGFFKLIKLAVRNLFLKKTRTFFTSLAISIGFVSMLIVLCLSRSFKNDLDELEKDVVSIFPISIYNGDFEIMDSKVNNLEDKIIIKNKEDYIHTNEINNKFLDYIDGIEEIEYVSYQYNISMPLISDRYKRLDNSYIKMLPNNSFINNNYDILYGRNINSKYEILLKVDSNNNVDSELLKVLNIDNDVEYEELIGRKFRIILNDSYYISDGNHYYVDNNLDKLYLESNIELKIVGIVKELEIVDDNSCFYYDKELISYIIENNSNSKIVADQLDRDYNILGIDMDKYELLSYLGYETLPSGTDIYVADLNNKNILLEKLDEYNKNNDKKLIYVDTMKDAIDLLEGIVNIITVILVVFSLLSIFVSSLMIFILTNNRLMERIKEIGILKSLGARNKDVVRLFNIENLIIGIFSLIIGVSIVMLLCNPINELMKFLLDGNGMFRLYISLVLIIGIFNIIIVILSGYIPIKIASKKNIVDCIYGRI